jgi:hypothetical protein
MCGNSTHMKCGLCGVHVSFKSEKKMYSLSCCVDYLDDEMYGLGMEDWSNIFHMPKSRYRQPTKVKIKRNREYMQGLMRRYDKDVETTK